MFKETSWKQKAITVWIIISIVYIVFDIFNRFVFGMYNNGYRTAINGLIEQGKNKDCKSFVVYNEKEKVELLNVACLKKVGDKTPVTIPEKK